MTATAADALATAVTVLGNEKGIDLINKTKTAEAILIQSAVPNQFIKTTGANRYILKRERDHR